MTSPIKFSVVTSTFNAGQSLARTAESLRRQSYRNFEWIIVDGASTDDTVEIARSFGELVTVLISEPDSGIYSAWNKVLPLITGDWVLFLGAGDELYNEETFHQVADLLSATSPDISIAYGNVAEMDDQTGSELRVRSETWMGLDGPWVAGRPVLPCHQGAFHRSSLFFGGFKFDTRCRISSDNEVMLREFISGHGVKLPLTVARFVLGGVSFHRINRLRMIAESIYINLKVGIFFRRPAYQLAVLASNAVKHIPRMFGRKI